jgi:hypothetical protein
MMSAHLLPCGCDDEHTTRLHTCYPVAVMMSIPLHTCYPVAVMMSTPATLWL